MGVFEVKDFEAVTDEEWMDIPIKEKAVCVHH